MDNLTIAVPSKGRLEEKASALFASAGLPLIRPARGYEGRIEGLEGVRVLYLSASEIATRLLEGTIHLGITGEDLLREKSADAEASVIFLRKLGFGKADVIFAIPDEWQDVKTMDDLAKKATDFRQENNNPFRVATKYQRLTGEFLLMHSVYDAVTTYSDGATEGAPASGAAEAIVDITSTGETLKANGLRVLDDGLILKSEANFIASIKANWCETINTQAKILFKELEARMRAIRYRKVQFVFYDFDKQNDVTENYKDRIAEFKKIFGGVYIGQNTFMIWKENTQEASNFLFENFNCDGVIQEPEQDMIYSHENAFFDKLTERLNKK